MVHYMNMPKLGLTIESSLIGQWLKQKGDYVKQGEALLTVETDKSIFEVESDVEGYILEFLYNEGDEVKVLEPIVVLGAQGEVFEKKRLQPITSPAPVVLSKSPQEEKIYEENGEQRIKISPRARSAVETFSKYAPIKSSLVVKKK